MFSYDRTWEVAAPPETVYAVAADHARYGSYGMKYLKEVTVITPENAEGWTESRWYFQTAVHWRYTLRALHDAKNLEINAEAMPIGGYFKSGKASFRFLPQGTGTRMVVHFEWDLGLADVLGPILEPLARILWEDIASTLIRVSEERARAAYGP